MVCPLRASLLLLLAVAGCASEATPPWQEAEDFRWRELSIRERGNPGFTEMSTRRTGVDFGNRLSRVAAIEQSLEHGLFSLLVQNEHFLLPIHLTGEVQRSESAHPFLVSRALFLLKTGSRRRS